MLSKRRLAPLRNDTPLDFFEAASKGLAWPRWERGMGPAGPRDGALRCLRRVVIETPRGKRSSSGVAISQMAAMGALRAKNCENSRPLPAIWRMPDSWPSANCGLAGLYRRSRPLQHE